MTEYDYSPDAVERFQAKMAGVGKWATDQSYWRSGYGNPFTPDDSTVRPHPPSRQESSSSRPRHRPQPTRSRTLPANLNPVVPSAHGQTSRALAYAQAPAPRPSTASASRNHHHRSGSQPPDVRNPYPYPYPAPPGHQVTPGQRGSPMVYAPPGARIVYKQYDYVPGKTTVLPQARPGEHFVVVAPPGAHVDRMRPGSHSRSSESSKAGSPTKKGGDPFLKRILTGLRPNIEWGDRDSSRSRSSSSRRESGKRRPASR